VQEKELIAGLVAGSHYAFRLLVDTYKDRLFSTSLSILHNAEDSEDIVQEVFIEIFNSIKNFRKESSLSTWIYRITITKSLDLVRKKNRKKRFSIFTSIFGDGNEIKHDPADFVHPGVNAENKELAQILFKAIDKLPESQKIAFSLNKVEGLSYKEISEIMGTSLSSVESLIHRAKNNLQKMLEGYYESL